MSLEDELGRLERMVLGGARVAAFLGAVELIRRVAIVDEAAARGAIAKLSTPKLAASIAAASSVAFDKGAFSAVKLLDILMPKGLKLPLGFVTAARELDKTVARQVDAARKLARAGADIETALAPLLGAANSTRRGVRTTIAQAGNLGVVDVTADAKVPMVWVAEFNACVHCLAYSGVVVNPGEKFPGGLTYAAKSPHTKPLTMPPLHPNCRCFVEPLNDQSYADALRREADRSVLRGFSLEGESMSTRIDAAERLIESNPDAPKSVIAYAKRQVKAGKFATRGRP